MSIVRSISSIVYAVSSAALDPAIRAVLQHLNREITPNERGWKDRRQRDWLWPAAGGGGSVRLILAGKAAAAVQLLELGVQGTAGDRGEWPLPKLSSAVQSGRL